MTLAKDPMNLIITGVGGQGNVLASQLIGRALVRQNFYVTIGETYGATQRGGAVMSHLRISRESQFSPLIPEGQADIVVALEPVEALRVIGQYGNPSVSAVVNSRPIFPTAVTVGDAEYPSFQKIQETIRGLGNPGSWTPQRSPFPWAPPSSRISSWSAPWPGQTSFPWLGRPSRK